MAIFENLVKDVSDIKAEAHRTNSKIDALPCPKHDKRISINRAQGYARWAMILLLIGGLGWVYRQIPTLVSQVSTLTEQLSNFAQQVSELATKIDRIGP